MTNDQKTHRLAVLTSHPIQYQAPLFQKLALQEELECRVYFNWEAQKKSTFDKEFGQNVQWDIPLLKGYAHTFLRNWSPKPSSEFWGQINFGIVPELIKNKYDAVLIFGWNSFTNWLAFITCFFTRTPILFRGENPFNQESGKGKLKILAKKIILGSLFKIVSAFLYIGEENKKFYEYYGVPERTLIFCPYAVDNDRFIKASEELRNKKYELRRELGIAKNDVAILFVGKLIEKKRPMDLLRAYEIITRNIRISTNIPNTTQIIEKELSYRLNGYFFEIHNELGRFARERQYADAFEEKLKKKNIMYQRELPIRVAGRRSNIADFIVENKVLVELKRKPINTGDDYRQIMRYLESADLELGLLANFGLEYLKPRRILNPKFRNKHSVNSDTFVNSDYGIHLLLVGDGALRGEMEAHVKEHHLPNVYFVGFKNQTEVPRYYALADILVLPSGAGETWGLAVNEGMCFGLVPIVSHVVGCAPDLVKHGENGFIFTLGDISALGVYMSELTADREKRQVFSKKSFEIIQGYSYDKDIEAIIKALPV